METTLTLKLTGTRPMLMHNGRLANPLDPHTRAIKAIAGKKKKTDADYANLALLESRGGMYEAPGDVIGLPIENVWTSLRDAGRAFKIGKQIEQALIPSPEIVPLEIDGATIKCDDYLTDHPERLSYVPVVVNNKRTMRARPIIPVGWQATVSFTLLDDVLQLETLAPAIDRAGRLVGLGDRRPMFGTYTVEVVGAKKTKK